MIIKINLIFVVLYAKEVFTRSAYKVCVPSLYIKDCKQMVGVETKNKATMECVSARDRLQCLDLIQDRLADFTTVDVEDIYIASKIADEEFLLFEEFRSSEEANEEFRYEAVMVIANDIKLTKLDELKGKKACHTGIDRNAGYKIPLTYLKNTENFPKMNDLSISPKENELKALSSFFTSSCVVGTWSNDLRADSVWKVEYKSLCNLCENSKVCDYPDKYSGYEGALRCLTEQGGQVAFTKAKYVRKFFGIHSRESMLEIAHSYNYFCPDGTYKSVKSKPCPWAARPWPALIGHKEITLRIIALREKIKQLAMIGEDDNRPKWSERVLGMSKKIHTVTDVFPLKPTEYLARGNFTQVIERGKGTVEASVRLCVTTFQALMKCRLMSTFAYSRDIRPRLDCVQEASETECFRNVQDNGSDLAAVDGMEMVSVLKKFNLSPVMFEVYGKKKTAHYAVAVVKKAKQFGSEQMKGRKTCHNPHGSFSGLKAPLYYLIKNKLINSGQCLKYMSEFFGGSCLPDVDKYGKTKGLTTGHINKLLRQCTADKNPLTCLETNKGDIAFVSSADIVRLSPLIYELLCLNRENDERDHLSKFASCHIAMIPPRIWVSSKDSIADMGVADTLLTLAKTLDNKRYLFDMYGDFMNNKNVLFNQNTTGLETSDLLDIEEFESFQYIMHSCGIQY